MSARCLAQGVDQSAYKGQIDQCVLSRGVDFSELQLVSQKGKGSEQKTQGPYEKLQKVTSDIFSYLNKSPQPVQIQRETIKHHLSMAYNIASTTGSIITFRINHRYSTAMNM